MNVAWFFDFLSKRSHSDFLKTGPQSLTKLTKFISDCFHDETLFERMNYTPAEDEIGKGLLIQECYV